MKQNKLQKIMEKHKKIMQKLEAKLKKRSKSYDVRTDSQKLQRPW